MVVCNIVQEAGIKTIPKKKKCKKAKWLSEEALQILKKVGKTTGPFSYDLNKIPYDYTMEVRNRFKGLDLIECLMNYGRKFVTLYRRQGSRPSP